MSCAFYLKFRNEGSVKKVITCSAQVSAVDKVCAFPSKQVSNLFRKNKPFATVLESCVSKKCCVLANQISSYLAVMVFRGEPLQNLHQLILSSIPPLVNRRPDNLSMCSRCYLCLVTFLLERLQCYLPW